MRFYDVVARFPLIGRKTSVVHTHAQRKRLNIRVKNQTENPRSRG